MAVAYDATGVGASGLNSTGSAVSGTSFNHTAASGADVFFAIQFTNSGSGSPSSVQYNGSTMTLVSSQRVNNVSTDGATFLLSCCGGQGRVVSRASLTLFQQPAITWAIRFLTVVSAV